jgi:hypothetical protein
MFVLCLSQLKKMRLASACPALCVHSLEKFSTAAMHSRKPLYGKKLRLFYAARMQDYARIMHGYAAAMQVPRDPSATSMDDLLNCQRARALTFRDINTGTPIQVSPRRQESAKKNRLPS